MNGNAISINLNTSVVAKYIVVLSHFDQGWILFKMTISTDAYLKVQLVLNPQAINTSVHPKSSFYEWDRYKLDYNMGFSTEILYILNYIWFKSYQVYFMYKIIFFIVIFLYKSYINMEINIALERCLVIRRRCINNCSACKRSYCKIIIF